MVQLNQSIIKQIFIQTDVDKLFTISYVNQIAQHLPIVNRYSIYQQVRNKWYRQQSSSTQIYEHIIQISQELSFELYANDINQITIKQEHLWNKYIIQNKKFLTSCLIQRIQKVYAYIPSIIMKNINKFFQQKYKFISRSVIQFNAAKYIIKQIIKINYPFTPQLILKSRSICKFIKQWFICDNKLYSLMQEVIYNTKIDISRIAQQSAAAAISILNLIDTQFTGIDLRRISIPFANLTRRFFDQTTFQSSNLQNVKFYGTQFKNVKFNECDMRGIKFNQQMIIKHDSEINCVDIDKRGKLLAVAGQNGKILIYQAKSLKRLIQLNSYEAVQTVLFINNGQMLLSSGKNSLIFVWNILQGIQIKILPGHQNTIYSIAQSRSKNHIVSSSKDSTIRIWNLQTGMNLKILTGHKNRVYSVCYNIEGTKIASGSEDKTINIWDSETGNKLLTLKKHVLTVTSVCFSPIQINRLVSSSDDKTIRIWNTEKGVNIQTFQMNHSALCVCYSPDGHSIVGGSSNTMIKIWDIQTGQHLRTTKKHTDGVYSIIYHPNGKQIVSGSWDMTAKLHDIQDRQEEELENMNYNSQIVWNNVELLDVVAYNYIYEKFDQLDNKKNRI